MTEAEARMLVEEEGITILELVDQSDDVYCFKCNIDGEIVEVDGIVYRIDSTLGKEVVLLGQGSVCHEG